MELTDCFWNRALPIFKVLTDVSCFALCSQPIKRLEDFEQLNLLSYKIWTCSQTLRLMLTVLTSLMRRKRSPQKFVEKARVY
jgi:hypothetical protein